MFRSPTIVQPLFGARALMAESSREMLSLTVDKAPFLDNFIVVQIQQDRMNEEQYKEHKVTDWSTEEECLVLLVLKLSQLDG